LDWLRLNREVIKVGGETFSGADFLPASAIGAGKARLAPGF